MNLTSKVRVAVLRGGPSREYKDSLRTGENILSALREMPEFEPQDIFISKSGEWHREGLVYDPHKALEHSDVVWNALHGAYGEDGQVQRVLESLKLPFTGSGITASALAMNKEMAKNLYRENGLQSPAHVFLTEENFDDDTLINIFRNFMHPVIIKPADATGALGVRKAGTFHELYKAIRETFRHYRRVIVEEYIKGDELSCVVLEGAHGEKIYAFEPVRIEQESKKRMKKLNSEEIKNIQECAKRAHEVLGLRHYSSSDFIITPKRNIYILETNALPMLHRGSILSQALSSNSWHHKDFVGHVLKLTL